MNLLFFAPVMDRWGKKLFGMLETLNVDVGLELHRSARSLHRRLCQPLREVPVAVIYLVRDEDLSRLLSLRELLLDVRLIVILPDRETDTTSKGHSFRPRFLTYGDADPKEIIVVLKGMLKEYSRLTFPAKERVSSPSVEE